MKKETRFSRESLFQVASIVHTPTDGFDGPGAAASPFRESDFNAASAEGVWAAGSDGSGVGPWGVPCLGAPTDIKTRMEVKISVRLCQASASTARLPVKE
ncbi:MAG: hypothetical protein P8123_07470 [bacterium]